MSEYGTVVSTADSPSTRKFSFVIKKGVVVRKGQFIEATIEGGRLIGRVADVFKTNRYFERPESVERYESSKPMEDIFPVGNWEYLVAEVAPLGVCGNEGRFEEVSFPPSPGTKVSQPDNAILAKFIGLDEKGLEIGELPFHGLKVKLNLTRLMQKHVAILAMSGAGKSYLVSVILEELLGRRKEDGQIAAVILDTHGEYSSLSNDPAYADKVKVFRSEDVSINLSKLSSKDISAFFPNMTAPQKRALNKVLNKAKKANAHYTIEDLKNGLKGDDEAEAKTKDLIEDILSELEDSKLFGSEDHPSAKDVAIQGKVSIIDLSSLLNSANKQIIVEHLSKNMFKARRKDEIPPVVLILEEAHQYIPEKQKAEAAIARGILNTIAREGRKFHMALCLVSQRPVQLSTTVLSQCNTHIILRVTNPYDLRHIGESSEGITKDVEGQISGLRVGTALIVGEAVNYPVFVRVRKRKSKESLKGMPLEEAAREFAKREKMKKEDAKSFM